MLGKEEMHKNTFKPLCMLAAITLAFGISTSSAHAADTDLSITQKIDKITGKESQQKYTINYTGENKNTALKIEYDRGFYAKELKVGDWDNYTGKIKVTAYTKDTKSPVMTTEADENATVSLENYSNIDWIEMNPAGDDGTQEDMTETQNIKDVDLSGTIYAGKSGKTVQVKGSVWLDDTYSGNAVCEKVITTTANDYTVASPYVQVNPDQVNYLGSTAMTIKNLQGSLKAGQLNSYHVTFNIPARMFVDSITLPKFDNASYKLYVNGNQMDTRNSKIYVNDKAANISMDITPNGDFFSQSQDMVIDMRNTVNQSGDNKVSVSVLDGDGKPITASGVFTAGSATGTATVTFTFNTNGMAGGAYVAFEEVYETTGGKETLWGTHMDLNDEAQTVYVPSISTNLIDENSQTNYTYIRDNVKAHDLVTYEGLIAGKTYKLTGTLVEKSTGKTFVDANGKTATITQTFTPDSDSGSVDMVFDINPSNLKTSALVAFETLSCNGEQVTIENDLDNEQQTLHFPILSTTAKGKVSGKNYVDIGGDMSIIDTIKYEGVQYGMTHTIKTYLVDKSTGKTVKDDNGNDIVKTTEWEPEATQGSIDVEIPVTGKKLAGRTLVVFEEIYLGDAMIACHKDINDANQTIKVKGYRDCTVIKRIKADDYWKEHGDPTFIFKLTGTDTLGASHTYYQSVTFTESYVKAHTDSDGYVEMKAIFGQVPAGEYTCSEESVSRFEFESLTKPVNATINGKTAVYHLTDNDTACATFANKKYEEGDFGHDSVVVNHFNHKTQD